MTVKTITTKINIYKKQLAEINKAVQYNKNNTGFSIFGIYLEELEYADTSLLTKIIDVLYEAKQVYETRISVLENHMETLDKIAKSFTDSDVDKI